MKRILITVSFACCIIFCFPGLLSADLFVDINQADDTGDGSAWGSAKKYLQSALAIAISSDNIYVAQGTYYPDEGDGQTGNDRNSTFQLISGVNVYGGYPTGGGTRNISAYTTILSGDLDQSGSKTANDAYHIITGANTTTIDGFTITGGNATGATVATQNGAGMYNLGASPSVTNCIFSSNSATRYAGGVHNESNASTSIASCTFSNNISGMGGGAINNYQCSPTISSCTFSSNQATGGPGGAIRQYSSGGPTISNSTFSGNTASAQGGAVYKQGSGTLNMTNCTLSNNGSSDNGGGVHSEGACSLIRCTFSDNQGVNGGGVSSTSGNPVITNCVFLSNTATTNGGGLYASASGPVVTNCTFYNNTGTSAGDGCYDGSSLVTIKNTILWGSNNQISGTPAISYSDVQQSSGTYSGSGNMNSNPLFVSASNLHLTDYSPCIGAGTASGAPSNDRDGNSRPNPVGTNPDMGAYENALDTSLPVEAVAFCAMVQNQSVCLEWITETEENNLGFIIERSPAGNNFETIASYLTDASLRGQGTSSNRTEYSFTDNEVEPSETYTYRLSSKDLNGDVIVIQLIVVRLAELPETTSLRPAFPNPFNPSTRIQYTLAEEAVVRLSVVDILGRTVQTIIPGKRQKAGIYNEYWNGDDHSGVQVATGVYHLVFRAGDVIEVQKVMLMR